MRSSSALFAFFLFILSSCPFITPASATADGPDFYAVIGVAIDDVLNIRVQPTAKSEKIGTIPYNGRRIKNLGCKGPDLQQWMMMNREQKRRAKRNRWCEIEYRGIQGWVAGRFLQEDH